MNRYKIWQINGLGVKKEIGVVVADFINVTSYNFFIFLKNNLNWRGKVTSRTVVGVYVNNSNNSIWIEELGGLSSEKILA